MSGRGLGHTGGTVDKMESIGMRTACREADFLRQVREIGCAVVGQSAELAPADKTLYALRDTTATVDSLPLIASSIMSKKLASGAQGIVLDVKVGSGAIMPDYAGSLALAKTMVDIGTRAGRQCIGPAYGHGRAAGLACGQYAGGQGRGGDPARRKRGPAADGVAGVGCAAVDGGRRGCQSRGGRSDAAPRAGGWQRP